MSSSRLPSSFPESLRRVLDARSHDNTCPAEVATRLLAMPFFQKTSVKESRASKPTNRFANLLAAPAEAEGFRRFANGGAGAPSQWRPAYNNTEHRGDHQHHRNDHRGEHRSDHRGDHHPAAPLRHLPHRGRLGTCRGVTFSCELWGLDTFRTGSRGGDRRSRRVGYHGKGKGIGGTCRLIPGASCRAH